MERMNSFFETKLRDVVDAIKHAGVDTTGLRLDTLDDSMLDEQVFFDVLGDQQDRLFPKAISYQKELDDVLVQICETLPRKTLDEIMEKEMVQNFKSRGFPSLMDVPRDSETWKHVQNMCQQHLKVVRVQMVHNELLEEQYNDFKARLSKKTRRR